MTTGAWYMLCVCTRYNSHRPPPPRCILATVLFFPFSNSPPIHFLIFPPRRTDLQASRPGQCITPHVSMVQALEV